MSVSYPRNFKQVIDTKIFKLGTGNKFICDPKNRAYYNDIVKMSLLLDDHGGDDCFLVVALHWTWAVPMITVIDYDGIGQPPEPDCCVAYVKTDRGIQFICLSDHTITSALQDQDYEKIAKREERFDMRVRSKKHPHDKRVMHGITPVGYVIASEWNLMSGKTVACSMINLGCPYSVPCPHHTKRG
jgi:hypothetical protein